MPAVCSICYHTFKHKYGLEPVRHCEAALHWVPGSVQDGELGEVHVFLNGAVARGGPGGGTRLFLEPVTSPSLVK